MRFTLTLKLYNPIFRGGFERVACNVLLVVIV